MIKILRNLHNLYVKYESFSKKTNSIFFNTFSYVTQTFFSIAHLNELY